MLSLFVPNCMSRFQVLHLKIQRLELTRAVICYLQVGFLWHGEISETFEELNGG